MENWLADWLGKREMDKMETAGEGRCTGGKAIEKKGCDL